MNTTINAIRAPDVQSRRDADIAARGMLMIFIVLGHNRLLSEISPEFFSFVYKWHVHAFFFLALAARGLRPEGQKIADILIRFLVPFFIFVTVATALNALRSGFSLASYLTALVFGSARLINAACDMSLFWFLPAFAGFLIVTGVLGRMRHRSRRPRLLLACGCAIGAAIAYVIPRAIALYVPMGLVIVAYLLPGAVTFNIANSFIERLGRSARRGLTVILALAFVILLALAGATQIDISLFKFGQVGPWFVFPACIALSVCAALILKSASIELPSHRAAAAFRRIGESSMLVFLVHSFVQAPLAAITAAKLPPLGFAATLAIALMISALAIAASLAAAMTLRRLPWMGAIVLPYNSEQFLRAILQSWQKIARRAGG